MKRAEDSLKENNRIESLKRSIELNDLHSIYSIMEDFVDAEIEAKNNESLHDVVLCRGCGSEDTYKCKITNVIVCKECGYQD